MPSFKDIVSHPDFTFQRPRPVVQTPPPANFIKVRKPLATPQPSGFSSPSVDGLTVGSIILHERFGEGVVERLEGSGLDAKATVRFQNVGTKQLLLRFAKFTVKH